MTDIARGVLAWAIFWFLPVLVLNILLYFVTTLPARRKEQGRVVLDLLEIGLDEGQSPEHVMTEVAKTRERSLGARFHLVAAYIENGLRLNDAIAIVPGLLSPATAGFLRAGEEAGDLRKGIQAAKKALGDTLGKTTAALHYGFVLLCLLVPFALVFLPLWKIFIWPKFEQIIADFTEGPVPPYALFIMQNTHWILIGYAAIALLLMIAFYFYIASPRFFSKENSVPGYLLDSLSYLLPWHQKRLQRDFSFSLGLLLEANVPEKRALLLAGETTGNRYLIRRAARVARRVERGMGLPEALRAFDQSGEFQWRLANAFHTKGFIGALAGWHESLESQAWQKEQTAAQILSAGMLILNGIFVGSIVTAVFVCLTAIIHTGALW